VVRVFVSRACRIANLDDCEFAQPRIDLAFVADVRAIEPDKNASCGLLESARVTLASLLSWLRYRSGKSLLST
jgi:hypothetical protein